MKQTPTKEEGRKITMQRIQEDKRRLEWAKKYSNNPETVKKLQYMYDLQMRYSED